MAENQSAPQRIALLTAIAISLILVAFALGMSVASLIEDRFDAGSDVTIIDDTTDDEDENDDTETSNGEVDVDWLNGDEKGESYAFNFYLRSWWETQGGGVDVIAGEWSPFVYSAKIIDVIEGGEFDGYYVVDNMVETQDGPGSVNTHFYLFQHPASELEATVLTNYIHTEGWGPFATKKDIAVEAIDGLKLSSVELAGFIDVSETLTSADSEMNFTLLGIGDAGLEAPDYSEQVQTKEGITLNIANEYIKNVFYYLQPDGRAVWYDLSLAFWQTTEGSANAAVPAITWNDGSEVGMYMKGQYGGCGFTDPVRVVEDVPEISASGYITETGEKIYEPVDYTVLADSTEYIDWSRYMAQTGESVDASISAFAKVHPLFYYQDPLDRWLQFTTVNAAPSAECGKPVIYLYPQTTTDISVQLAPQGGFTKTEPDYGNGWHVTASPNGALLNKADGLIYPYLFWEGRGGLYSEPEKYWVVAKDEVPAFLDTTLARLGFNTQEIYDFKEFWVPRMQNAAYYKIGFHGTSVMNAIAPMTLSQPADTLIRVLMDYSELSESEPSNPPKLPMTPKREGFVVTEWGGVIR